MFLSQLTIKNFRQFGARNSPFTVEFNEGVTAQVGENDAGKSAVTDAIRHVLTTRDMDFMRLQPEEFHLKPDGDQATEITISARLSNLATVEKGAFAEYLTYDGAQVSLYVHWSRAGVPIPQAAGAGSTSRSAAARTATGRPSSLPPGSCWRPLTCARSGMPNARCPRAAVHAFRRS
jgi:hypothetical protein